MLKRRGQTGLEPKILAWPRPRPWPRNLWPRPRDPLASASSFWSRPRTLIFNFKEPAVLSFRNIYCSERISILLLLTLMVTYLICWNTSIKSKQLSRYITLINSDSFDSTAESSALSKLYSDFALLQPLFQRLFCVPASSAPVARVFSQSGLIMSSHWAHMSNAALKCLVFLM